MHELLLISELMLVALGIAILVAATAWLRRDGGESPQRDAGSMGGGANTPPIALWPAEPAAESGNPASPHLPDAADGAATAKASRR